MKIDTVERNTVIGISRLCIFLQCIESRQKVECYIYAIYGTAPKIQCKVHVVRCHCSISIDLGKSSNDFQKRMNLIHC